MEVKERSVANRIKGLFLVEENAADEEVGL